MSGVNLVVSGGRGREGRGGEGERRDEGHNFNMEQYSL